MKELGEDRAWIDEANEKLLSRTKVQPERIETSLAAVLLWFYRRPRTDSSELEAIRKEERAGSETAEEILSARGYTEQQLGDVVRWWPGSGSKDYAAGALIWPESIPLSGSLRERLRACPAVMQAEPGDRAGEEPTSAPDYFREPAAVGQATLAHLGVSNYGLSRALTGIVDLVADQHWKSVKEGFKALARIHYEFQVRPIQEEAGEEPEGPGNYFSRCAGAAFARFREKVRQRFFKAAFPNGSRHDDEGAWEEGGIYGLPEKDTLLVYAAARLAAAARTGADLKQSEQPFLDIAGADEQDAGDVAAEVASETK